MKLIFPQIELTSNMLSNASLKQRCEVKSKWDYIFDSGNNTR